MNNFRPQIDLLLRTLPLIVLDERFALKGGTAINFFVNDMQRFSIDADLTYLPIGPRKESLEGIEDGLVKIRHNVESALPSLKVFLSKNSETKTYTKAVIRAKDGEIKVEPNLIFRGSLLQPDNISICNAAQKLFGIDMSIRCLNVAELYGGKLCAALDRQHPRDLFDIKVLLESIGLSDGIKSAFIIYLVGADRPFEEVLKPRLQPLEPAFTSQFLGMTKEPIEISELIKARNDMLNIIPFSLSNKEYRFLISLMELDPQWDLMPFPNL